MNIKKALKTLFRDKQQKKNELPSMTLSAGQDWSWPKLKFEDRIIDFSHPVVSANVHLPSEIETGDHAMLVVEVDTQEDAWTNWHLAILGNGSQALAWIDSRRGQERSNRDDHLLHLHAGHNHFRYKVGPINLTRGRYRFSFNLFERSTAKPLVWIKNTQELVVTDNGHVSFTTYQLPGQLEVFNVLNPEKRNEVLQTLK